MIEQLRFYDRSAADSYELSVLIPTWNNLPCLQRCIQAIRTHSTSRLQLIVIVNEGQDGSLDWLLSQEDIAVVHAAENVGICYALNSARSLIKAPYLIYLNDDMMVLPGWETSLLEEARSIGHDNFLLSGTMIEPRDTGNLCVIVAAYGHSVETYREEDLLANIQKLEKTDWMGATWPPVMLSTVMWDLVGGLSAEFSPGMYSDPDLSMKLYQAGVRLFKGVGKSRVYHFGSQSTGRIRHNTGRRTFLLKWGMTSRSFTKGILKSGQPFTGPLPDKEDLSPGFINRMKRMLAVVKGA